MTLLLDTHTFIWFINGDKTLPSFLVDKIKNLENRCFLSIASIWEIAIKTSLQKLELKSDFNEIKEILINTNIELLPITFENLQVLTNLQYIHRDPFDRLIIAQGISENLTIVSKDEIFAKYVAKVIWD
jgi:PIN domain nuclease of toxin-antitoxin system